MTSLALFAAVAVLFFAAPPVRGDDDVAAATVATTLAPVEEPTPFPFFYCKGICGEGEEGELVEPGLEVEYQWNLRVPVCSGSSCQSTTCQVLSDRLRTLAVDEFECRKHQKELQYTAGCGCSDPFDDDFGMWDDAYVEPSSRYVLGPVARYTLIGVAAFLFVAIWIGFYLGVRRDDRRLANEAGSEDGDNYSNSNNSGAQDEEVSGASY
eukprot:jgi/Psemu1/301984/fgenesh1_kg.54_\